MSLSASLVLMLAVNCRAPGAIETSQAEATKDSASRIEYNPSGTMALELFVPPVEQTGQQPTRFQVIRLADSTVVYRGDYMRGYVRWVDDTTLEKLNAPEKPREDADLSAYKTRIQLNLQSPVEK